MLLLLLLFPQTAMAKNTEKSKTTFPVQVIHKTGNDKENFVIVIMGDGYTASQQDQFLEDATQKARGMLTWSPYKEYSDRINIYAVQAVSNESGIGVYGGKSPDTYFHVKVYGKAAGFTNGGTKGVGQNWKKIIWMKAQMLERFIYSVMIRETMAHRSIHFFLFRQIPVITVVERLWHMRLLTVLGDWAMNMRDIPTNPIRPTPLIRRKSNGVNCWDFAGSESRLPERIPHLRPAGNA